ncbi:MAG: AbrB/MazE/SpoVT family DNA-binding domain-containing protein [Burkholderiales bacterium]
MSTLVTSKGQVTIPKKVRDHLGIRPGTAVDFEAGPDGRVVLVKKSGGAGARRKASRFAALRGTATVKLTTRQIMALTRGED